MAFYIFLSHLARDGDLVAEVAIALEERGLHAFASGRDIPESVEWLPQIEAALLRADALAAFLDDGYRQSEWTDQEVGYVLGRGLVALPLRSSPALVPHGFLSRYQAVEIGGLDASGIADKIIDGLVRYQGPRDRLMPVLIKNLRDERRGGPLSAWVNRLVAYQSPGYEFLEAVASAGISNPMIRNTATIRDAVDDYISATSTKGRSGD